MRGSRGRAGTRVPAFELPWSRLASDAAARMLVAQRARPYPMPRGSTAADLLRWREEMDATVFAPAVRRLRRRYAVALAEEHCGGVPVTVVRPAVTPRNTRAALIALHGGAFIIGGRLAAIAEAIPLAVRLRVPVFAVDYRQAPEHRFPAASEDVAAVYRALLADRAPGAIGFYGSSAGAVLVAQSLAWLQRARLPVPGAAGLFGAGAGAWADGDSGVIAAALAGESPEPHTGLGPHVVGYTPYLRGANLRSPLVMPVHSRRTLARFPPTLLVAGTRASELSAVVHTHAELVAAGVDARLHVWEGLGHAFHADERCREARQAGDVIAAFFARTLKVRQVKR